MILMRIPYNVSSDRLVTGPEYSISCSSSRRTSRSKNAVSRGSSNVIELRHPPVISARRKTPNNSYNASFMTAPTYTARPHTKGGCNAFHPKDCRGIFTVLIFLHLLIRYSNSTRQLSLTNFLRRAQYTQSAS